MKKGRDRDYGRDLEVDENITYNLDIPLPKWDGYESRKLARFKLAREPDQFCLEPKRPAKLASGNAVDSWRCESLLQPGLDIVQLRSLRSLSQSASLAIAGALRFVREEPKGPEIENVRMLSPDDAFLTDDGPRVDSAGSSPYEVESEVFDPQELAKPTVPGEATEATPNPAESSPTQPANTLTRDSDSVRQLLCSTPPEHLHLCLHH
jgi:hypothetical protein